MFEILNIPYFIQVVRYGSFSMAAQESQIPKSTLSRKISELEKELGVQLIKRTTRKVTLTVEGENFYRQCLNIEELLSQAKNDLHQSATELRGHIRMTAPVEVGTHLLGEKLARFHKKFPHISVELILLDRIVDFITEQFDLALRAGKVGENDLKAVRVGREHFVFAASPQYLASSAKIKSIEHLAQHPFVLLKSETGRMQKIEFHHQNRKRKIEPRSQLTTNSFSMVRSLGLNSAGVIYIPRFLIESDLAAGRLELVLPACNAEQGDFWIVYRNQKLISKRLRILIDFLKEEFSRETPT